MFDDGALLPARVDGSREPPGAGPARRPRPVSPWARLGLRRNPFGEPPPEEAGALVVEPELDRLAGLLCRPRAALQVLGEEGRGKTARLRALGRRFPAAPYVYLPEDGPLPRLPPVGAAEPGSPALLLDEAQRLPRRRRRRLFRAVGRRGASVVLGSHEDLGRELEGAGLRAETVVVRGLAPERLRAIIDRRLEWARLDPAPGSAPGAPQGAAPRPDRRGAEELIARFGDDLRGILDHLYETYQDLLDRSNDGGDDRWRSVT